MRFSKAIKLLLKVMLVVVWLIIGWNIAIFGWLVCQGPDNTYILDSNYVLWNWPGALMRLEPVRLDNEDTIDYINVLARSVSVTRIAVLDTFIVGKAGDAWFAVNRKTHRVWYPYSSPEALKSASGVTFSASQLRASRPWSRLVISPYTKVVLPLIALLVVVPVVGFRWTGRILRMPFKYVPAAMKKRRQAH